MVDTRLFETFSYGLCFNLTNKLHIICSSISFRFPLFDVENNKTHTQ